jgi:hypothetical protein
MGCVDKNSDKQKDLLSDMSWGISKGTGCIQLTRLIPLDILYQSQHAGAVGNVWINHHKEFAKFVLKQKPTSVLEIGGAHGILSKEYSCLDKIKWTILEPNPAPVDGVEAEFINGFFDSSFSFNQPIDTIIHSHVFEHIYYPDEFVSNMRNILTNGQMAIFSVPNMEVMLQNKYTNCIDFEHTVFLTEPYIEHLMSKHGFILEQKEYYLEDHSIFYAYVKHSDAPLVKLPKNIYKYNEKIFLDYLDYYHNQLVPELNQKIKEAEGQPIFLFGAHGFSQYLIEFGLSIGSVICLLDNDKNKQKQRLYGTNLEVESPSILKEFKRPIVILKAGAYDEEIKSDIIKNINPDVIFW